MIPQRRLAWLAALLAAFLAPSLRARADDGGAAAALALFAEGRRLMAAGDFADACPKFAESKRLAPGVGTMLNLALCYEGLGKTASAWSLYLEAAASAREKGQTERQTAAQGRAARLEPDLLRATITVAPQPGIGAIEVKLDGRRLPNELLGAATPMDPGRHEVEATAPGKQAWVSTIDVEAGHAASLQVPVLAPIADSTAPPKEAGETRRPSGPPAETPRAGDGRGMKNVGILLGAAGAVSVGIGIAFALAANNEKDNSQAWCSPRGCFPQGAADLSRAGTDADIASVTIPLGIAAASGGGILWLLAPRAASVRGGRLGIGPSVGQNRWSLTAAGAW